MTSSNEEALIGGPRDRSYSENTNPTDTTMGTETVITNNAPNNKMAITNKKNSHPHRHGNDRPRSKSCDRHCHHSPSVHKKKYSTNHSMRRIIPGTHSPSHRHHGSVSPKSSSSSSSQQLRGKMWIRPVATRTSTMPFRPVLASVAHSPNASSAEQQVEDSRGLFNDNNFTPVAPKNVSPFRQVTVSPILDDDEMMLYTSPNSSFDSFQRHGGRTSPKSARIIFGESGKPIKPRNAF